MKTFQSICLLVFSVAVFPWYVAIAQTNHPPEVTASGNQVYCPGTPINIVTSFSITDADPGDTAELAVYIQISSGYDNGYDLLTLNTPMPGITTTWDATAGKLTIKGANGQLVPFATLEEAVDNVVFNSTNPNASGNRTFSISIGEANYLPSTGHYYRFISSPNITWTAARAAAEADSYYGLQGYLVTIMSQEEAQLCGEQASGTGWIGGSDAETEGVWKWVTGPEAGTVFWNGGANGSTPNFAFWNIGEPNNFNNEDYAHVTAPGVGTTGSWNDLPNEGSTGQYVPKGYIVEFGGMPGDPVLNIAASTAITINAITSHTNSAVVCDANSVTLQAQSSSGTVYWYDEQTGGSPIATGNSFTTPIISFPATYYASAYDASCATAPRVAVQANVVEKPLVSVAATASACGGEGAVLSAETTVGTLYWYDSPTAIVPLATGETFRTPAVTEPAIYYVEASNDGCMSDSRYAITVTPSPVPVPIETQTIVEFCSGSHAVLDAMMPGVNYLWSTGKTTESITVTNGGMYMVDLVYPSGCSATRTFIVVEKIAPVITDVLVENTKLVVIVENNNPEDFEFSIDGGAYQNSNVFYNASQGSHLIMARSLNGCGDFSYVVTVNLVPKYFSPNGDGVNDVFTLAGMNALPQATVNIFDRYGKHITQLNRANPEWDGTYNGRNMPATDYWYVVKVNSTAAEIFGHFSLIR